MELTGQVRHRRKLTKQLFFIDIQPLDQSEKSQIFFRNDDDSLDFFAVQEAYKQCKPGQIIQVTVIPPLDPSEQENRDYKVWQSVCPVKVIEPYVSDRPFVQDRPLAAPKESTDNTCLQTDKSTVCKYWINKNTCIKGDECPFRHPTGQELIKERQTWIEERTKNRLKTTHDPNDPHTSNKQPHALRAFIFADWIRRTFEQDLTGSGAVLDIAAGKGEISMFLSRAFGIPSIVIEPQERKRTNYWYIKLRRLMYRYETGSLERPDWENKQIMIDFEHWPSPIVPQYMHTYFDEAFLREHHDLVSNASLFIGLHPDQATMSIVDMAIKMRKPFAVVPCCVFSQENQTRKLKTGKVVMTFEGKNRVVYWKP